MEKVNVKTGNKGIFLKLLAAIGPGIVTAAIVFGPGSATTATQAGATLEYSILWVYVAAFIMMATFTRTGAVIGVMSDRSLLTLVREKYGTIFSVLMGIAGFLICSGFQTGNNIGVGLSMSALFGGSIPVWAVVFTVIALYFLWSSDNVYKILEKIMMLLVMVMLISFFANLFMIHPPIGRVLSGVIPRGIPNVGLITAISGTTFSIAAAAFQAYSVKGKNWNKKEINDAIFDAIVGIGILVIISVVIMITSGTVLFPRGIKVKSAMDMAVQLEPLMGAGAKWLFVFGLWAASFSSFIGNAMVGGTLLADGLGIGDSINSRWSKIMASVIMILGTLFASLLKANPIQMLVMAQAVTIFGAPLMTIIMWLLANDEKIVGEYKNKWLLNIISVVTICWVMFLSIRQLLLFVD
ncbi:MAG TPA: divalent metal cation transporter [Thermoanaerobacterales bacterium]|nr:divalent metal cation transporter [Thermoanaerobacterales bacterium]